MNFTTDDLIIGTGQAGPPLAKHLAKQGRSVVIVESGPVGGSCVNVGCTPTKTLIASAQVAHQIRRSGDYGVHTTGPEVNFGQVMDRMRSVVRQWRTGAREGLEQADGVSLVRGLGRFLDPHTIGIYRPTGEELARYKAERVFLDVGSRPRMLPLEGMAQITPLTHETLLELDHLPKQLVIIGGGYVGVEFAQLFARLGSEVTIVHHSAHLLSDEDEDIAQELQDILAHEDIRTLTTSTAQRLTRHLNGFSLQVDTPTGEQSITGTHLLMAVGIEPRSDQLNLEAAQLSPDDRGYIPTNEYLQTDQPHIFALGEVAGTPAFTHMAYDDYRIVRDFLGGQSPKHNKHNRLTPYTVFTDPQLGRVGLTEAQARAQGYRVHVAKLPAKSVARSVETGQTAGLLKVVVDAETDQLLGGAMLLPEGGEVMAVLQVAMEAGLPWQSLRDGNFAHPTYAEALNNLLAQLPEEA